MTDSPTDHPETQTEAGAGAQAPEADRAAPQSSGHVANTRHYRYYDMCMVAFVTVLLCSNLIGPGKTCLMFGVTFGAGNLFFPISYIFGDVLTEVYGYARARKVIWAGFGAMVFATVMGVFVIHAPPNPDEPYNKVIQPALEVVFGNTWRIVAGSILAFWVGDFVNSYVMARMKVLTGGRFLWMRTIGSTVVGQLADSAIFYPVAFAGDLERVDAVLGDRVQLGVQGGRGGGAHAAHLPRGRLAQARRARGLLRQAHQLHAVLAARLGPCDQRIAVPARSQFADARPLALQHTPGATASWRHGADRACRTGISDRIRVAHPTHRDCRGDHAESPPLQISCVRATYEVGSACTRL